MNLSLTKQDNPRIPLKHAHRSRVLHWFTHLGALGLFAVAVVDCSLIPLPLPGSTDLLLLFLVSHGGSPCLLVSTAIAGSILGGYTTWQIGRKGGRAALVRHVPARLLEPLCEWVGRHPVLAVFLPATLPPPAPLTTFVLASGALGVSRRRFLMAFGSARSLRYTVVAWLGATYGRHVVRFWSATIQKWSAPLLWVFVAVVVGGVGYGMRKTHTRNRASAPQTPPIDTVACLPD